jgi:hypothetical protein
MKMITHQNDYSSNSRRALASQSFDKPHSEPAGNSFDPDHREKSPRADHLGSSDDKWLPHIGYAAAAPLHHPSKLIRVCQ